MKRFALIGAAGFIAPRHMRAIKETGNELVAALDPHDSVGILDRYFPECHFFTEFERFDRHIDKLRRQGNPVEYLSICSPNYLHDAHCRFGLRNDMDVICEKPLVLNTRNIAGLQELEREKGKRIYSLHQLRLHPSVLDFKQRIKSEKKELRYKVNLECVSPRGKWYQYSWKGVHEKSGGIAANIGIHYFDLLLWLFGPMKKLHVEFIDDVRGKGTVQLERADVSWFLSIVSSDLLEIDPNNKKAVHKRLSIDNKSLDLSIGEDVNLHTMAYTQILSGEGIDINSIIPTIDLVSKVNRLLN